ncbi:acetoin utilization protein AcuC [Phytoactinopolyspora halotolerans]|uniref:Acetoin utilization protein AcuC n=1 Tax=Phytoactinopolyspora halotolerans TaxID=1981512 RepID=A0A6L9S5M4_9ACTN|nr:acetoin utilization protein AcuC [Phytoactinopolyspora halotolerans]NEE00347.1 acetoin utilization protein AcuC [Phytoactinopolyspora halotolerans]
MDERGTTVYVAWDESLMRYDFGPNHPMNPVRLDFTVRLAREMGVLSLPGVRMVSPDTADDELLTSVHNPDYVQAVRDASADPARMDLSYGLGTDDVPCFSGMHDVSARILGGTVAAARSVWKGTTLHGVSVAGGLHHAMPGAASGFCVYNDVAAGIQAMLDAGAERVAYVDVDVHHGDGVQAIFYDDPRVLTISLHENPQTLFPGTGFPHEVGGGDAEGSAVNVALPPGTGDAGWLRAFHAVVPPLLRTWKPQVLVSQHGCDSHIDDPLAHLALTVDGQRAAELAIQALADELCDGRWLATGGGGYALADVVPRTWTHLLAIAAGRPISPETPVPESWRTYVGRLDYGLAPLRMTDGADAAFSDWEDGYDPADWLDQAILATRTAVFPLHGLDPHA